MLVLKTGTSQRYRGFFLSAFFTTTSRNGVLCNECGCTIHRPKGNPIGFDGSFHITIKNIKTNDICSLRWFIYFTKGWTNILSAVWTLLIRKTFLYKIKNLLLEIYYLLFTIKLSNIYKFTKLKINEIKTLFDYFDSISLLDKSNNLFNLFNSYFAINKIFMIILFLLSLVYYVVKRSSGVSEEFINLCIPQMCTT